MMKPSWNPKLIATVAIMLVTVMSLSSCEPLRKKFSRKKKQAEVTSDAFQPVLEPQEYEAPERNVGEIYKQHYAMVKVWYKDLWAGVNEGASEKTVRYAIKQINERLEEMKVVLRYEKAKGVSKLQNLLEFYKTSLDQPLQVRNYSRVQSDLREFDRVLRREYGYDKVKDDLVQ
jgi:hypothetical protein